MYTTHTCNSLGFFMYMVYMTSIWQVSYLQSRCSYMFQLLGLHLATCHLLMRRTYVCTFMYYTNIVYAIYYLHHSTCIALVWTSQAQLFTVEAHMNQQICLNMSQASSQTQTSALPFTSAYHQESAQVPTSEIRVARWAASQPSSIPGCHGVTGVNSASRSFEPRYPVIFGSSCDHCWVSALVWKF